MLYKVEPSFFVTEFSETETRQRVKMSKNYIRGCVERVIDAFGGFDIQNLVKNVDHVTDKKLHY